MSIGRPGWVHIFASPGPITGFCFQKGYPICCTATNICVCVSKIEFSFEFSALTNSQLVGLSAKNCMESVYEFSLLFTALKFYWTF